MATGELSESDAGRLVLVTAAWRLVAFSVTFGVLSGAVSVVTGLQNHSLGVFAAGLSVLADVTGSAVLLWRFRAERRELVRSEAAEARAAAVVAIGLAVVGIVITIESAAALASGSHPGTSGVSLAAAVVSLVGRCLAWIEGSLGLASGPACDALDKVFRSVVLVPPMCPGRS